MPPKASPLTSSSYYFPSPTSNSPQSRLQNITDHMSQPTATSFPADAVPQAPVDPLFGLMAAYREDTFDKKVDLGIGAYRDDNAKPWVLPVVKQVMSLNPYSRNPANHYL
jgi:aspartate aminotransferase